MRNQTIALLTFVAISVPSIASAQGAFGGFYGGAAAGYGFNGTSEIVVNGPSVYDFDIKGSQISLMGGYNYQSGNFVIGIEGDANLGKVEDAQTVSVAPITYSGKAELGTVYSLRVRAGFTPSENLLLYGTAGPAWGKLTTKTVLTGAALGPLAPFTAVDGSKSSTGYILGIGGEYNILAKTTVRLEYSELYLNDVDFVSSSPFGGRETFTTDNAIAFVRTGVTFRF
jgi:outer membrane immunogenic protein